MKNRKTPEVCPVCGEDVPPKAKACPSCGACHESGWKDEGDDDGAAGITEHGYEDEEKFDYDRWRAREEGRERPRGGIHPIWKWVALILLIALFWGFWKWIYQVGTTRLF
jgi:hypothetical protein